MLAFTISALKLGMRVQVENAAFPIHFHWTLCCPSAVTEAQAGSVQLFDHCSCQLHPSTIWSEHRQTVWLTRFDVSRFCENCHCIIPPGLGSSYFFIACRSTEAFSGCLHTRMWHHIKTISRSSLPHFPVDFQEAFQQAQTKHVGESGYTYKELEHQGVWCDNVNILQHVKQKDAKHGCE